MNEETWNYFYGRYGGECIVRSEFELRMVSPYVIEMNEERREEIMNVNANQVLNRVELLECKRL